MFVSRDEDGNLNKVPVPLHYAYLFVAAAAIGMFTITGLAGSYSRMLIKTARFNQLRQDHDSLQKDYAHLEKAAHEKDIQAASLGSLASEVSALYGLTASKLTLPMGRFAGKSPWQFSQRGRRCRHCAAGRLRRPLRRWLLQVDRRIQRVAQHGDERRCYPASFQLHCSELLLERSFWIWFRRRRRRNLRSYVLADYGPDYQQLRSARRSDSG